MLLLGTRFHDGKQLRRALAEADAQVSVSSGTQSVTASFSSDRQHFIAVLRLVVESFRYPELSDSDFLEVQRAALLSVNAQHSSPEHSAWSAINRVVYPYPPGDIRRTQSLDEKIAAISRLTVADVRQFHSDFYGASAGELAAVGDFDPSDLLRASESIFGGWTSRCPFQVDKRFYTESQPVDLRVVQPGRQNSIFEAGAAIALAETSPDYPALVLGVYLMGGGFLNARLPLRLRRQDALSYWVESALYGSPVDQVLMFLTTAACEPDDIGKVRSAFASELQRSLNEGFTDPEIEKAKRGWLRAQQLATARDEDLAMALGVDLFARRSVTWRADLQRKVASLSAAQVNRVWRKYVRPDKISFVEAGDIANPQLPHIANTSDER